MLKQFSAILALTATNALLQVGHGAVAALAVREGGRMFSETSVGFMVSAVYAGFLGSNLLLYRLLPRVSYIRTYAVCAAVMASLTLLLPMLDSEIAWIVLRLLHGLFLCAAVIICDGWLNATATNENRSKLWGLFMTANYLSFGAGQYILLAETAENAFMLAAVFLALCLVPMCLTRFPEPQTPSRGEGGGMGMRDAYAIAPVSFVGQFLFGIYTGSSLLFISYAEGLELEASEVSLLAALFFGCGFLLQMPAGWLADRARDRRDVILGASVLSALAAFPLAAGGALPFWALASCILVLGAFSSILFSLHIAYGQDFVEASNASDYAGMLMRAYALGALAGPPAAGFLMSAWSANALFLFLAAVMGIIALVTATTRLMPRYRPARPAQFRPLTPLSPMHAVTAEETVYSETDIGPEAPSEEPVADAVHSEADIGPEMPEEAAQDDPADFVPAGPPDMREK